MIKNTDIKDILKAVAPKWKKATNKDIAFAVLCDSLDDKQLAYSLIYGKSTKKTAGKEHYASTEMKELLKVLKPFGIGGDVANVTRDENKAELIRMLDKIKVLVSEKKLDEKDALKMETDIRVKLNDKFDMGNSDEQRRIIIVPQKHDYICPATHKECSKMPSKEACIEYYHLKE